MVHLASFPCCSQQIPPAGRAEGEGSPLRRAKGSETPAAAGPRAGSAPVPGKGQHGTSRGTSSGSVLAPTSAGAPGLSRRRRPCGLPAQQLRAHAAVPTPRGSGSPAALATGSKPSTGTAGTHQLSQRPQPTLWEMPSQRARIWARSSPLALPSLHRCLTPARPCRGEAPAPHHHPPTPSTGPRGARSPAQGRDHPEPPAREQGTQHSLGTGPARGVGSL